jgi:hypothetical protein
VRDVNREHGSLQVLQRKMRKAIIGILFLTSLTWVVNFSLPMAEEVQRLNARVRKPIGHGPLEGADVTATDAGRAYL